MTTESIKNGLKYIHQGLTSSNNIISHFKKVEKALKTQEETIEALKAELAIYKSKDKEQKKRAIVRNKPDTTINNPGNKKETVSTTVDIDTNKSIHRLQQETKLQQLKIYELAKENEDIKKENRELKTKMNNVQKKPTIIKPTLIDTKNQTMIPRLITRKRSSPFDEIQRRFSPTGTVKPITTTSNKRRKSNQL